MILHLLLHRHGLHQALHAIRAEVSWYGLHARITHHHLRYLIRVPGHVCGLRERVLMALRSRGV